MVKIVLCLVLLLSFISVFSQKKSFCGKIIDAETNKPVTFASVYFQNGSFGTFSDEQGQFCLHNIPENSDTLFISHIGYQNRGLSVQGKDLMNSENEFRIKPISVILPEVSITDKHFNTRKTVRKTIRNYWKSIMHDEYISKIKFLEVAYQDDECVLYRDGEAYLVSLGYDWDMQYSVYNFFPYKAYISKQPPALKDEFNKYMDTTKYIDFRFQTDALLHRFRQVEDDLLNRNIISKYSWPRYKYKLDSVIRKYNRDVAVISFYHPKWKYLNGTMMVDITSKQLLKIDIVNLSYSMIFNKWVYPVRYTVVYAKNSSNLYPAQIIMVYQKEGIEHYTQISLFEVPIAIQKQSKEFKKALSRANAKIILQGENKFSHENRKPESTEHPNHNCIENLSFYKKEQPFPYRNLEPEEIDSIRRRIESMHLNFAE